MEIIFYIFRRFFSRYTQVLTKPEGPDDTEAFTMFKQFAAMEKAARAAYESKFGPLTREAAAAGEQYKWLQDPWPWNYQQNEVK